MFIDRVKLKIKAGTGGNGIVSFRREKYVPLGGPYGGDGGNGGNIVFIVDTHKSTLLDLHYKKHLKADDGVNGKTKKMTGARGDDNVLAVPQGTIVKDLTTGTVIADLVHPGQSAIIARGGRGGRGNWHFATSRNPAPDFCEKGEPGEEKEIQVELKLLADAGLVGFPSVGKSTFLSVVSSARPEIADYHFTTIVPNLGVVGINDGRSFVVADLPGLIEGAHQGKGLGHQFLRHIERCRVIIHVVDMGAQDGRDPVEDFRIINDELGQYQYRLLERPQVMVANKMDLDNAQNNLKRFKEAYPDVQVFEAITLIREGLDAVLYKVADLLDVTPIFSLSEPDVDRVMYKFEAERPAFEIERVGDHQWRLYGEAIEKRYLQTNLDTEEELIRFSKVLRMWGVDDALRKAGAKDGDIIALMDITFIYVD